MEPSLLQFLCDRFPDVTQDALLAHSEFDTFHASFREFLENTHVVINQCSAQIQATRLGPQFLEMPYNEFIDFVARDRVNSAFTGPSESGITNFKATLLKGTFWERLCHHIGRQPFVDLLGEVSCFLRPQGNIMLRSTPYSKRKPRAFEPLRKFHMYFSRAPSKRVESLLSQEPDALVRYIFRCSERQKHIPKKYRSLMNLFRLARANDQKLQYKHVLHNVVPQEDLKEKLFENAVPFSQVTRFVFVVLHRVFPNDIFGNQKNWNIMNQAVYDLLKTDRTELIDARAITQSLEITAIPWLGKSQRPSSKQDHAMRLKTLHQFVGWFLSQFVVRIVSSFWYVTENPLKVKVSEPANVFFLHHSWSRLSRLWLNEYTSKYLHAQEDNSDLDGKTPSLNCGILRLVPKKSDFRPLCIPMKVSKGIPAIDKVARERSRKQHISYDYNVMRPIREILRNQQRKHLMAHPSPFPRCDSVRDVGSSISMFKKQLLAKFNGKIPTLYGVQFDMKHCYDNLNQVKILQCTDELFQNDSMSEEYFVRKYAHSSKGGGRHPSLKSIIKKRSEIEELDTFSFHPITNNRSSVCSDRLRTFKFIRADVLDLVRSQVLDAATELPKSTGSTYKRTRGVFQGFPLSGTLCDIVYNAVVDKVLGRVQSLDHQCLLLRLADDFLFISTSKDACAKMLELARCREAKEFGAHVNFEKLSWINATKVGKESAHFLGLTIDLQTLCIERTDPSVISLSKNFTRSLKATLSYLSWRFRLRVADYLFDMSLSDFEVVLRNISHLINPTINCAMKSVAKHMHEPNSFHQVGVFVLEIFTTILHKFEFVNGKSQFTARLLSEIRRVTMAYLVENNFPAHLLDTLIDSPHD